MKAWLFFTCWHARSSVVARRTSSSLARNAFDSNGGATDAVCFTSEKPKRFLLKKPVVSQNRGFMSMSCENSASAAASKRAIAWFRSDLRVHDNPMLAKAAHKSNGDVIAVYCLDPRIFRAFTELGGFPKTGGHRAWFLLECLVDLRANLEKLGGTLVVQSGMPEEVLPQIAQEFGVTDVFYSQEACTEELSVETAVRKALPSHVNVHSTWGACTLHHLDDLPLSLRGSSVERPDMSLVEQARSLNFPQVFSSFRRQVEKDGLPVRRCVPAPTSLNKLPTGLDRGEIPSVSELIGSPEAEKLVGTHDSRAVMRFVGGETAGRERVTYYTHESQLISTYKGTRNGMLGEAYSSKFSPWLAHGCISSRWIWSEINQYERSHGSNESTYWLVFELLWRDYFRFAAIKKGSYLFRRGGEVGSKQKWSMNRDLLESWIQGETGFPLVDANMRELSRTGFMSNRGRQNVASFLIRELRIDWRLGAEWFESLLLDSDPCSNYGNWQYIAGVGDDPRGGRRFNVVKQGQSYDPNGDYPRHWLPELENVPQRFIYDPYRAPRAELERAGVVLGTHYPLPVVNSFGAAGDDDNKGVRRKNESNNGARGGRGRKARSIAKQNQDSFPDPFARPR